MGKSKAPKPPDPKETASAQTGTNIGTAIANNTMGMINQFTPDGSLTYEKTGGDTYTDPFTGKVYDIPQYTATTELSPEAAAIDAANKQTQRNLADTAVSQSAFLQDYLGSPADLSTGAIEDRLTDLARQRIDPRMDRQREAARTMLANQGLAPGSEAYNNEMELLNQSQNDAYNQLYLQGRGQAFGEAISERNQPINEIIGLLSGSQVQNPAVSLMGATPAATTDVAGIINNEYGQRLAGWQQQQAQKQALLGGLFGLGSNIIAGGGFGGGRV